MQLAFLGAVFTPGSPVHTAMRVDLDSLLQQHLEMHPCPPPACFPGKGALLFQPQPQTDHTEGPSILQLPLLCVLPSILPQAK